MNQREKEKSLFEEHRLEPHTLDAFNLGLKHYRKKWKAAKREIKRLETDMSVIIELINGCTDFIIHPELGEQVTFKVNKVADNMIQLRRYCEANYHRKEIWKISSN